MEKIQVTESQTRHVQSDGLNVYTMVRGGKFSKVLIQWCAVVVTLWFSSHLFYVIDRSYRNTLRTVWTAKYGAPRYEVVLPPDKMLELNGMKKRDYLSGHAVARDSDRAWAGIESKLEESLFTMFNRTDPMKGWELKKLGNAAWRNVSSDLKSVSRTEEISPTLEEKSATVDMNNVLVYNRIPKSGSTMMLGLLYSLAKSLGYLVVRGRYHSYRYWTNNDQLGLGYFLEQAAGRARTVYVQHQYYVNFTENRQHQPLYINMMRDPVEHLVSSYDYKRTVILQHRGPGNMTKEELEIMSQPLEQCVVERRLECVYYGYTVHTNKTEQLMFRQTWSPTYLYPSDVLLYFCGHHPSCSLLGSKTALQIAKDNVEQNFAVVGVLEHLTESLAVMEDRLPQFFSGLSEQYKRQLERNEIVNKNLIKSHPLSKEAKSVLRELLSNEYELYDYVKQKLFRQFKSLTN